VLLDNLSYNPAFQLKRFSGRPLWDPPRPKSFRDALLADIKANGIQNPVCVYDVSGGLYVVYGASRVWAAREIGLNAIPAIVSGPELTASLGSGHELIDLQRGPESFFRYFRDPPGAWRVERDGYLNFTHCHGAWDLEHNPKCRP
jgi:hypothetical protein